MGELNAVGVFLGSSTGTNPAHADATVALANELVARNITLVYGGGAVGLMGLLADTVLEGGGEVIGVIPRNLFGKEVAHRGNTELIETDGMHERKALMYDRSDAFIALPGGIGTLDELAETATWNQIGIQDKPVGLLNIEGYYDGLIEWLDRAVTDGFIRSKNELMSSSRPDRGGEKPVVYAEADPALLLDTLTAAS